MTSTLSQRVPPCKMRRIFERLLLGHQCGDEWIIVTPGGNEYVDGFGSNEFDRLRVLPMTGGLPAGIGAMVGWTYWVVSDGVVSDGVVSDGVVSDGAVLAISARLRAPFWELFWSRKARQKSYIYGIYRIHKKCSKRVTRKSRFAISNTPYISAQDSFRLKIFTTVEIFWTRTPSRFASGFSRRLVLKIRFCESLHPPHFWKKTKNEIVALER